MNLQVGVKAIFKNKHGRILLIKRAKHYKLSTGSDESWDVPGGRIQPEESLLKALAREINEEIGLSIENTAARLVTAQDIFAADKDLHVVRLTYLIESDIDDITLSDEHSEHGWFNMEEINALSVDPYLAEALQIIKITNNC